jgi:hypothetical protein
MSELAEGTQLIYVNWVRMSGTPFELGIDVGYNDEQGPPETFPARLVMSWEHVKAMADLLNRNIAEYEAQAGEIREVFEKGEENQGPNDD